MKNGTDWISRIARIGLVAKGIVYLILGVLAFMAAFELGGQSDADATRNGVFHFIKEAPAGIWLLVLLSAGLVCYSIWRGIQAFTSDKQVKWGKRLRYLFSALAYLSVAFTAVQIIRHTTADNGDRKRDMVARLMESTSGTWLAGILALLIAAVGFYQIWYGISEKYKKHVQQLGNGLHSSMLLVSGKIGYTARGIVWLIIAYLLLKAALHANAAEAGDSGKAFHFIEQSRYGSYWLGALGVGLMAYGVFNFIRARYESFRQ